MKGNFFPSTVSRKGLTVRFGEKFGPASWNRRSLFPPRKSTFSSAFFSSQKPTATTVMATFFPPRLWPARISAGQSAERLPIFHSSSSSTHTLFVFFFYPVGKSGFGRGRKKRFREANLVCESRKNRADYGPRHPAGTETAGTWGIASFFFCFFLHWGTEHCSRENRRAPPLRGLVWSCLSVWPNRERRRGTHQEEILSTPTRNGPVRWTQAEEG